MELARRAVDGERDAWKKALRIERWVKNAMRNDNAADLVPASQIARSLRGDCRHHAFLTAAMCRAVGVPSRTAIGLLYVYQGGPQFGFHTWAEVYIDGRWVGIDSTQGRGGVSATHLKITQHSWDKTESLTPLLPVNRILGKLRIEVLRASSSNGPTSGWRMQRMNERIDRSVFIRLVGPSPSDRERSQFHRHFNSLPSGEPSILHLRRSEGSGDGGRIRRRDRSWRRGPRSA